MISGITPTSFGVHELVLRFEQVDGYLFQVRASLDSYSFTDPVDVDVENWPPRHQDEGISIGDSLFRELSQVRSQLLEHIRYADANGGWLRIVFEFPALVGAPSLEWLRLVGVPWERVQVQIRRGGPITHLARRPNISIVRAMPSAQGEVIVSARNSEVEAVTMPTYRHIEIESKVRNGELDVTIAQPGPWFEVSAARAEKDDELEDMIARPATVVHLTAHGTPDGIPLSGGKDLLPKTLLRLLVAAKPKLVMLSVCYSAAPEGLVAMLPKLGLSGFVAMQGEWLGTANSQFVAQLFDALKAGQSIDEAVSKGRAAALAEDDDACWAPAVYLTREARQSPWFWSPAPPALEPLEVMVVDEVGTPTQSLPPVLPPTLVNFAVSPGSCFVEFNGGLVEIYPGSDDQQGLRARRVLVGDEDVWKPKGKVSSVALDPTGHCVACTADGKLYFARVTPPKVLESDWTVAQDLTREVSAAHGVTLLDGGGVKVTVTIGGAEWCVHISKRGRTVKVSEVDELRGSGTVVADSAHGLTVTLQFGPAPSVVVEYEGDSRVFQAPTSAIGVSVVRRRNESKLLPDFIVRTSGRAALWNASVLSPAASLA